MIGILVEKPSAGRNFAKALGGMTGTYNGEQYVIVSARGHLYEFKDPKSQVTAALVPRYSSWSLDNLPWNERDIAWKREKKKGVSDMLKQIKSTLSGCKEVVIATDVDPTGEGQLLAWEILDELNITAKWSRMYFTDEAPKSLQNAFVTRKVLPNMLQDPEYQKALYRSKFDFMSMQFTRIATSCGNGEILRQGRLKSAMVSIVGDGLKAVASYKKVPFYSNKFRDENGNVFTSKDEPSFPNKDQVPQTYSPSAVIVDSSDMKRTAPPALLDLAGMSSNLSSKGVKAKDVLAVYQKMYESQIVSYPRTEDKCVTPEQFNELLPFIDSIAKVVGIDPKALSNRSPRPTHVKTGGAHGANRPGVNVPASLDALRLKYGPIAPMIYEILALNYLAILAPDYEYELQKGHLVTYPSFLGTAKIPKKMGYKAIFNDSDDDDEDNMTGKGLGKMANPFIHEGFPPKPPTPTMKWLMQQLKKCDVGTGATRTSTYADVTNDKSKLPPLLVEQKGKLTMSKQGEMSYYLLKDTNIGDVKITEELMKDMRDIAGGKANPDTCLNKMQRFVKEDVDKMKANSLIMQKELGVMNQTIVQKEKCEGMWNGTQVSFNREWAGHRFTDEECADLLAGKEISIFDLVSKAGKTYGVKGKLSEQDYQGRKFIGFERLDFATKPGVPDKWCGYEFSAVEKQALDEGRSIEVKGCVSSKGNTFDCSLSYGMTDKGSMGIIPKFG